MFYGAINETQLLACAIEVVRCVDAIEERVFNAVLVRCPAVRLILETAAQETHLGHFRDPTPHSAGAGICQIDPIGLEDIRLRTNGTLKMQIRDRFGIDINTLTVSHLEYSPLASMLAARLHYRLRPGTIPVGLDGRAQYWKIFYNTRAGKGRADDYIDNAKQYVAPLVGGY